MTKGRALIAMYLVSTGILLVIYIRLPRIFFALVQEDQLVEWVTFLSYFIAGILFMVVIFLKRAQGEKLPWFYFCLAAGCFFIAGEEISWGQRILGFATPEAMARHNFQGEFNIHNLGEWGRDWPRRIYVISLFFYLIVLPYMSRMSHTVRHKLEKFRVVVPPMILIVPYLCSLALPVFTKVAGLGDFGLPLRPDYVVEVMEMYSGFVFIHFAIIEFSYAKENATADAAVTQSG